MRVQFDRIFMKFHTNFWFLKVPLGKNLIFEKKPVISLKVGLIGVSKKFVPLMCYFGVYMMHRSCLYDYAKTACFGKISFSSHKRNCSLPIRLQDFLSFDITEII